MCKCKKLVDRCTFSYNKCKAFDSHIAILKHFKCHFCSEISTERHQLLMQVSIHLFVHCSILPLTAKLAFNLASEANSGIVNKWVYDLVFYSHTINIRQREKLARR